MVNTSDNEWFLAQLKPNGQRLAIKNLQNQGFKTFCPMQEITKLKPSRFVNELRPLFPGYIFISCKLKLVPWQRINGTLGISRLVRFGEQPCIIPQDLISGLMSRCDRLGNLLAEKNVTRGQQVRFLTGPFANFIATVEDIDSDERVWTLFNFLGQSTRVRAFPEQLSITRSLTK